MHAPTWCPIPAIALGLVVLLIGATACHSGGPAAGEAADRVRAWTQDTWIHRDAFGVPHVESTTDAGAVFGWMYARAEDEYAKIEEACFLTLGRNAEHLGEAGLGWDRLVHALDVPRRAKQKYAELPSEIRVLCVAAALALNRYQAEHPEEKLGLIDRFEPWHWVAQSYSWHLFQAAEAMRLELGETIGLGGFSFPDGSNAWAVAPRRTRRGHALLLVNPHMPLGEVFEGALRSEQGLSMRGGAPFGRHLAPIYGHNDDLAWALTVNRPDVVDLLSLVCSEDDGVLSLLWAGEWLDLPRREVSLQVKTATGPRQEDLTIFDSPVGPLVGKRGAQHVAIAVAGIEDNRFLETHLGLVLARTLAEFQSALAKGGFLFHNVVYADRKGHIWYAYGGLIPRRQSQDSWVGLRPVDGENHPWQGYLPLDELPQVLDPEAGWIQNCNSSPFSTSATDNPKPADFPTYVVGEEDADARSARARRQLTLAPLLDLERLAQMAFDLTVGTAATWIGEIEAGLNKRRIRGPEANLALGDSLDEALEVLKAWDGVAAVDSVATTLFFLWFERYVSYTEGGTVRPSTDAVLAWVLEELTLRCGTWRVRWGDINRLRRPGSLRPKEESLPISGGHGAAGIQATFLSRFPTPDATQRFGYRGSAYLMAIELGDPIRSLSIKPYGQSRDPESKHFEDQSEWFAAGRMKTNPGLEEDPAAWAEASYQPGLRARPGFE